VRYGPAPGTFGPLAVAKPVFVKSILTNLPE
jgi:hypothetical protein